MNRAINMIFAFALVLSLALGSDALGISKTPKAANDTKPKAVDTSKASVPKQGTEVKSLAPVVKDSASNKQTPAKLDDFQDKNKNGVDDRLEKPKTTLKKTQKSTESKSKSNSSESKKSTSSKTSTKKTK